MKNYSIVGIFLGVAILGLTHFKYQEKIKDLTINELPELPALEYCPGNNSKFCIDSQEYIIMSMSRSAHNERIGQVRETLCGSRALSKD